MPLVLGFAGLLGMVLLLTSAITGASFADVITGKATEVYRGHEAQAESGDTAPVVSGGGAAGASAPVHAGPKAADILSRLRARRTQLFPHAYSALSRGRIDQGVDFGGAGPVHALADGVVRSVGLWHGWPGRGGLVYDTAIGPIFIMEDFATNLRPGQRIRAGQIIGHATGGSSGIETGLANRSGTGPLTPYNGAPDGTPMPGGQAFAMLLDALRLGGAPR